MPSSSLSYCRAIVIAESRSAWADLLFLGGGGGQKKSSNRNVFLRASSSSLPDANAGLGRFSVFHLRLFQRKDLFDGVGVLDREDTSQTNGSTLSREHTPGPQSRSHLEHLRAGLVVSLGVLNQQVDVFSHGTNASIVAQLEGKHSPEFYAFYAETVKHICDVTPQKNKANLNLLCDDFQIYRFLDDGVIIWVLLETNEKDIKLSSKSWRIVPEVTLPSWTEVSGTARWPGGPSVRCTTPRRRGAAPGSPSGRRERSEQEVQQRRSLKKIHKNQTEHEEV